MCIQRLGSKTSSKKKIYFAPHTADLNVKGEAAHPHRHDSAARLGHPAHRVRPRSQLPESPRAPRASAPTRHVKVTACDREIRVDGNRSTGQESRSRAGASSRRDVPTQKQAAGGRRGRTQKRTPGDSVAGNGPPPVLLFKRIQVGQTRKCLPRERICVRMGCGASARALVRVARNAAINASPIARHLLRPAMRPR